MFEHSMGELLTYGLCHKFQNEGNPALVHICLRRKAPQLKGRKQLIRSFPKHEFISEILKLDGTDNNIFKNKELEDIFLPILRTEFKSIEPINLILKAIC
ncbi:thioesterase II family protein [Bacillus velezensis]|uniref:thioesterase II family protein n=1 Tax=Bacillus velezensis TaxID=492670 RepID=UPI0037C11875